MSTTAKFTRRTNLNHADSRTILFTEKHHRARLLSLVNRHFLNADFGISQNFTVNDIFHCVDLIHSHGFRMSEVKTRHIGTNPRTTLLNMITQYFTQCVLE